MNPRVKPGQARRSRDEWMISFKCLSLVFLDDLGWSKVRVGRIATEFFQGAALAQQIPVLIELDLDFPQPFLIGIGRRAMLVEALLFRDQFANMVEHRLIRRLRLLGGMFVWHLQLSERVRLQLSARMYPDGPDPSFARHLRA